MFTKIACEEIIDDTSIKVITSPDINYAVYNNNGVKVPILYFDDFSNKYSLLERNDIKWNIVRLYDCIKEQVFYFIATQDQVNCKISGIDDKYYDKDIMDFVVSAALCNPRYVIDVYYSNHVVIKEENSEIIFCIDLDNPISKENIMPRDYRTKLGFIDCVSLLSDYKEELNTTDQEG